MKSNETQLNELGGTGLSLNDYLVAVMDSRKRSLDSYRCLYGWLQENEVPKEVRAAIYQLIAGLR